MGWGMQVTIDTRHKQVCFKLSGSLDLRARPKLAEMVECRWHEHPDLLLDLSEVREIDLSGLSWLMLADSVMRGQGGRLNILAASRPVQRALQLLNPATRCLWRRDGGRLSNHSHILGRRGATWKGLRP